MGRFGGNAYIAARTSVGTILAARYLASERRELVKMLDFHEDTGMGTWFDPPSRYGSLRAFASYYIWRHHSEPKDLDSNHFEDRDVPTGTYTFLGTDGEMLGSFELPPNALVLLDLNGQLLWRENDALYLSPIESFSLGEARMILRDDRLKNVKWALSGSLDGEGRTE